MFIFTLNHEVNARVMVGQRPTIHHFTLMASLRAKPSTSISRGKCTSDTRPLGRVSIILPQSWAPRPALHFLLRLLHRIPELRVRVLLLHAMITLHHLLHPRRLSALPLTRPLVCLLTSLLVCFARCLGHLWVY